MQPLSNAGKLAERTAKRYLAQMATAISYCHARNVFHRDLKPENVRRITGLRVTCKL